MSTEIINIKRHLRARRNLAENSFRLKTKCFGKKLLNPVNQSVFDGLIAPDFINETAKEGKKGEFCLCLDDQPRILVKYKVRLDKSPAVLELSYSFIEKENAAEFQEIEIETQEFDWGTRWYFKCGCGDRCAVLYLTNKNPKFGCLECQNITYQSRRLNKKTLKGLPYYLNRKLSLAKKRENMDRIYYRGKKTKRAERFFGMIGRLDKAVRLDQTISRDTELAQLLSNLKF